MKTSTANPVLDHKYPIGYPHLPLTPAMISISAANSHTVCDTKNHFISSSLLTKLIRRTNSRPHQTQTPTQNTPRRSRHWHCYLNRLQFTSQYRKISTILVAFPLRGGLAFSSTKQPNQIRNMQELIALGLHIMNKSASNLSTRYSKIIH